MKKSVKYCLDAIMSILMIVCIGYQVTGSKWHEILGIILFVLFLIHCILNIKWFKNYFKIAKASSKRVSLIIPFIVNNIVIIGMIALFVTSVMISKELFSFLNIQFNFFVKRLHIGLAYGEIVVLSIHLGCHLKQILTAIYGLLNLKQDNKVLAWIGRILAIVLIVSGVFCSIQRNVFQKMNIFSNQRGKMPQGMNENFKPNDGEPPQLPDGEDGTTSDGETEGHTRKGRGMHNGKGKGKQFGNRGDSNSNNDSTNQSANSTSTNSAEVEDGESLDDYLSRLVCTGCGRQCPLISPKCATGETQASEATEKYNNNDSSTDNKSESSDSSTDNKSESDDSGSVAKKPDGNPPTLQVSGDDDLLHLFMDFIPITGMYVAGTYYVLEFIKKKENKKEKKKKEE